MQTTLDGQDIIIQQSDVGLHLACLLAPAPGNAQVFRRGDAFYWRIPHSHEVDRLLMELTDLFISILCWPKMHIRSKTRHSRRITPLGYSS